MFFLCGCGLAIDTNLVKIWSTSVTRQKQAYPICVQKLLRITVCVVGVAEVLKGMQELGVSPDVETLSSYILPVFPSMEAARQALKVMLRSLCACLCVCVFVSAIFNMIGHLCSGCRCVFGVRGVLVFRGSYSGCRQPGRTLQPV